MSNVKVTGLADEIIKCLSQYTEDVTEALEETKGKLADEAVRKLKTTSPRKSGKYARGWRSRKVGKKYIVHNTRYQLTHLLEKGHAKRNGGRVAAIPHIAPVEKEIQNKAIDEFKRILK